MEAPEFILHHSPELNLVELAVRQVPADTCMLATSRSMHADRQSETERRGTGCERGRQADTLPGTRHADIYTRKHSYTDRWGQAKVETAETCGQEYVAGMAVMGTACMCMDLSSLARTHLPCSVMVSKSSSVKCTRPTPLSNEMPFWNSCFMRAV